MAASYVVGFLFLFLAVLVYFPPPDFSKRLLAWQQKGKIMRYIEMDIFYIDEEGTGESGTVICLHGVPSNSHDWTKILPELKEQFSRVILLDFLGLGFSEKPTPYIYSVFEQADIVEDLARHLQISKAHFLSHDYGDTVALELLSRYNKKKNSSDIQIETLCLLNGGLFPGRYHPRLIQKVLLIPVIGSIVARLTFFHIFKHTFAEIFGENKPSYEEMQDFYAVLTYRNGHTVLPELFRYMQERSENEDRWVGALKRSTVPVLMIYGPADPINPPPFPDHFRRTCQQHGIIVLEDDIGHYPQWEAPKAVVKHYRNFISQRKTSFKAKT